jgi:small subunit ribosomal protein S16
MIAIRLKQMGTKSRKQWRIIVTDQRRARDGSLIEEIGFYNPFAEPVTIRVNKERYNEWIQKGAEPSRVVRSLMKKVKA